MSRLGDMIRNERIGRNLTPKQVARMCGVSESYVTQIESGTRIINDDAARRMLKAMGKTEELVSDFEATSSGEPTRPAAPKKPEPAREIVASAGSQDAASSAAWMEAVGGIIKRVAIRDALGKEIGHRMLPTENGKIEGAAPDKVFYLSCPDATMRGYRLRPGDLLLVIPAAGAIDGATMVLREGGVMAVRRVTRQDGGRALLQWFEAEPQSKVLWEKEAQWVGRVVRCEFTL